MKLLINKKNTVNVLITVEDKIRSWKKDFILKLLKKIF